MSLFLISQNALHCKFLHEISVSGRQYIDALLQNFPVKRIMAQADSITSLWSSLYLFLSLHTVVKQLSEDGLLDCKS